MKNPMKHIANKSVTLILVFVVVTAFLVTPGSTPSTAATASQSFLVQGSNSDLAANLVMKHGGIVTSRLDIIDGVGALLQEESVSDLLKEPGIRAITSNQAVSLAGNGRGNTPTSDYPNVVGADLVWDQGTNGANVTVAVVDTGLGWHPGLFKDINKKVRGRILAWKDFVDKTSVPRDPNGHGTHVAGIIANTEIGEDNEWDGVAPGINLVGVRVLNDEGYGTYEQVIQGIQWVVKNKNQFNIRVMNLSLVSLARSPYWANPLNKAVMKAWAAGITVIVSAGNGGPKAMTIGVPGNTPYVVTVGAFTDNYTPNNWNDDYIAPFSAAGPTLDGFVKPDVVAPGAHIVSTTMPWSYISRNHEANYVAPTYFEMAGTSQATAVVSGLAALILSRNPELTPDQVKYRLMSTAFPWVDPTTTNAGYSIWQQGAGRVNAPDAVNTPDTGQANQGMDIQADLAGITHYEGFTYFDKETGKFILRGDFSAWDGGYGTWSGGYGTWSGGYGTWSGGYGTWSGGYGTWSGGYGTWSGGYGTWSGGYGTWSGGYGAWSGGYGTWSGGYGAWSGSEPWAGSELFNPEFISNYLAGVSPNTTTASTAINDWVDEP